MEIIIKTRPRKNNESKDEYIKNLKEEGVLTNELLSNSLTRISDNGDIFSESSDDNKDTINNILDKRSKRINIFVPESFYNDIQFLQVLYPKLSLSEIVVKLADDYFDYVKKTDFWDKLNKLKELKNEREKVFIEFLKYKEENQE